MSLSSDLISQFVKTTNDNTKEKTETTVYGKVVESDGRTYVQIDGSDQLTPVSTTANAQHGERVSVLLKNHTATIVGNFSSPAARVDDLADTDVLEDKVTRFEYVIADKASIEQLDAEKARIDTLYAENVTINDKLTAAEADIDNLQTNNLEVRGKLTAAEAVINDLDTNYANIDFTNIGEAAMGYFYSQSGLIKNVIVGNQTITGELVGVTISGDRLLGNTIIAEKLVIKGSDGLYYKLNTDGMKVEAQQTDENSLNGQVIKAKSITATKISVDDLVAFDATIGGFNITENAIYSGVKESVNNTTRGIYLDKDGQMTIGDSSNYLKYYKDTEGSYKLAISAKSISISGGTDVETAINNLQNVEVGGRNLLKGTQNLKGFYANAATPSTTYATGSDGYTYADFPVATSAAYRAISSTLTMIDSKDVRNRQVVLSFEMRSDTPWTNDGSKIIAGFAMCSSENTERLKYRSIYVTGSIGNEWTRFNVPAKLTDDFFTSGSGSLADCTRFYVQIYNYSTNHLQIRKPKLEYGNKATDWTPAPEDLYSAVDDVKVGGRNLLRHTEDMPIVATHTSSAGIGLYTNSVGTLTDTGEGLKLTYNASGQGAMAIPLAYDGVIGNGETVTLSFKYRGNINRSCQHYILQRTSPNVSFTSFPAYGASDTEWLEYKHTFSHVDANARTCYSFLLAYNPGTNYANGWFEVKKGSLKLERGNKATDWVPAKEDVDSDVTNAAKTASNFISYDSSNGLQVGNKSSGSWNGFRTQITNAAFRILNSTGTVLASYGDKLVELGRNATDAVIKLCGGKGTIEYTSDYILQLSADSIRLKGVEEASLYANYTDSDGVFRNGAVHAAPGQVTVTAGGGSSNSTVAVNPTSIQMTTTNFNLSGTVNDSKNGGTYVAFTKGTSGIWTYKKYANGDLEMWGSYSVSNIACTEAMGNMYRTAVFSPSAFPFTVYNPNVVSSYESDGYGAFLWATTKATTAKPPNYYLVRPTSTTISSGVINFHVLGKWKN